MFGDDYDLNANIKVIGVGGAGCNAVELMIEKGINNIKFIATNTDHRALERCKAPVRLLLAENVSKGLLCGNSFTKWKSISARDQETPSKIKKALENTDLLFIVAGMGGTTGTYYATVIAKIAREMNILTIGVVSKPFNFEGKPRLRNAEEGIAELLESVDSLIVILNDRLLEIIGNDVLLREALKYADEVLCLGVMSICNIISNEGLITLDLADLKAIMQNQGTAHIGIGKATGKGRAENAVREAITSPLIEIPMDNVKTALISFITDSRTKLKEISIATMYVQSLLNCEAEVMFGATIDESLNDETIVTIIVIEQLHQPLQKKGIILQFPHCKSFK